MRGVLLSVIARHLGVFCENNSQVTGYQVDSRLIQPGNLFFALKGDKTDGHCFLADAAERGAIGAVVSKGWQQGSVPGLTLLGVEDVAASLQELGRHGMAEKSVPVIGVTGSVGKTTTKEFLATLLEGKFKVGKSPSSYNSQITFPLNLLNRSGEEQVLVLEMGMSSPGEITKLVEIATPDIGVITKVALSHAMNFPGGLSAIMRAKAEIFSQAKTKTAILDWELLQYKEVIDSITAKKVTFSIQNPAADYFLSLAESRYRMDERGVRAFEFDLPFKASHLLQNFTAAVAAARQMGMQWEEIERQIPRLHLPKMRFEQFEKSGVWFVNDAYNANPTSMRAALENLPEPKEGCKRIAVLGTMKELGSFSRDSHEEIGRLAQKRVDMLLCLGEETAPLCEAFRESKKPTELYLDHAALAQKLSEVIRPGDVVLIKGSRSMQMEKVIDLMRVQELPETIVSPKPEDSKCFC